MMNISIIGAGNQGTAFAADLGRNNHVSVYSSRPGEFADEIEYVDSISKSSFTSRICYVSDSYEKVVEDADIVFLCLPTFLMKSAIDAIAPFLRNGALVGFVPGAGGTEFLAQPLKERDITVFGFERVPYISRIEKYGRKVSASKKPSYRIAALKKDAAESVSAVISSLFNAPCGIVNSYLAISLTPTLHYSRTYTLFASNPIDCGYPDNPRFYSDWTDRDSELCLAIDDELHRAADAIGEAGMDLGELVPYRVHYESPDASALTRKLNSIESLKNISSPMVLCDDGLYRADFQSRYFTESFPYRLCLVKDIADIARVDAPNVDSVLRWYEGIASLEWFTCDGFHGRDLGDLPLPQNCGISNMRQLTDYYL